MLLLARKDFKMIITYHNYKGGINNLIVVHNGLDGKNWNMTARSTKGVEQAIKNFKRKYERILKNV